MSASAQDPGFNEFVAFLESLGMFCYVQEKMKSLELYTFLHKDTGVEIAVVKTKSVHPERPYNYAVFHADTNFLDNGDISWLGSKNLVTRTLGRKRMERYRINTRVQLKTNDKLTGTVTATNSGAMEVQVEWDGFDKKKKRNKTPEWLPIDNFKIV